MCSIFIPTKDSEIPATTSKIELDPLKKKKVIADFDGGLISSDAGALLLKEAEKKTGIIKDIGGCITDKREPTMITHTTEDILYQLIFQICCGYEDLNDSKTLRRDPVLKLINNEAPISGKSLASAPTLCRFENKVTSFELIKIGEAFVRNFVRRKRENPPKLITIDLDATEDKTYGQQFFSFYHGYYGGYCFLPLIVTACCDDDECFEPIAAILRPGNVHASKGSIAALKRITTMFREAFPDVRIRVRGDCGYAVPELYRWLENQENIEYVIGFPKNSRVKDLAKPIMFDARAAYEEIGEKVRFFDDFYYTAGSWKKKRRIICKAEITREGENPRFLVTNMKEIEPQDLYDDIYVRRGEMENRINELKNGLKMDRTSCTSFKANQMRIFLTLAAFHLFLEIRRNLKGTQFEKAQVSTIREKLLKIGARVKESVRRIRIHFSSGYPLQTLFRNLLHKLRQPAIVFSSG